MQSFLISEVKYRNRFKTKNVCYIYTIIIVLYSKIWLAERFSFLNFWGVCSLLMISFSSFSNKCFTSRFEWVRERERVCVCGVCKCVCERERQRERQREREVDLSYFWLSALNFPNCKDIQFSQGFPTSTVSKLIFTAGGLLDAHFISLSLSLFSSLTLSSSWTCKRGREDNCDMILSATSISTTMS